MYQPGGCATGRIGHRIPNAYSGATALTVVEVGGTSFAQNDSSTQVIQRQSSGGARSASSASSSCVCGPAGTNSRHKCANSKWTAILCPLQNARNTLFQKLTLRWNCWLVQRGEKKGRNRSGSCSSPRHPGMHCKAFPTAPTDDEPELHTLQCCLRRPQQSAKWLPTAMDPNHTSSSKTIATVVAVARALCLSYFSSALASPCPHAAHLCRDLASHFTSSNAHSPYLHPSTRTSQRRSHRHPLHGRRTQTRRRPTEPLSSCPSCASKTLARLSCAGHVPRTHSAPMLTLCPVGTAPSHHQLWTPMPRRFQCPFPRPAT